MQRPFTQKILSHLPRLEREQLEHYLSTYVQHEHLLHVILDAMTEAVIAADRESRIVFANAAVYDVLGVPGETAVGQQLADCLRDPALHASVLAAGIDAHVALEVPVQYPRRLLLGVTLVPLAGPETAKAGDLAFILLLRDVSSERMRSSMQERESRLETLRLLTAGVAHEIGNPLAAIILHTQLLDRALQRMPASATIGEAQRINKIVFDESSRLKNIVGDFLHAVRPLTLRGRRGQVEQLVEDVFELLYTELAARKVAVVKDFKPVPQTIFDADQLRGAVINVVRNAMDALPNGGTLTATIVNRGDRIDLAFADDGCGIEPERLGRVFQPFYTTKPQGSGLGLFIVQRVLQAHGGAVRISSSQGKGATVTLELPVRERGATPSLPLPPRKRRDETTRLDH